MRPVAKHIIHCSDSRTGDVNEIRKWHLKRGWRDIGYHFVILVDGTIEVGRPIDEVGAHCYPHNTGSIGTCLIGTDVFLPAQFAALKALHQTLKAFYPSMTVHGHNEFNENKTCPNFDVHKVIENDD